MSALSREDIRPVIMLGGIGYLVILSIALIWLHLSPEVVLALTVGGFGLLVLGMNPLIGVHAFLMLSYVEYAVPEKEGLSGMKLMGAVILSGWLITTIMQRRLNLRFNGLLLVILFFFAWCGVSTLNAIYVDPALGRMFTFGQLIAATAMFYSVVDTVPKLRGVFWATVIWTTLSTIIALVMYYLGMTPVAVGLIGNRNLLATYISIAVVCAYLLYQITDSKLSKLLLLGLLPVLFLGLALTLSRTGLIALSMALLVVWYRILRDQGFLLLAGSMALLCFIVFILPDTFWIRVGTIVPAVERQEDTFGIRMQLWKVGMRMVEDRPITGVGPANYIPAFDRYARGPIRKRRLVAHNSYVSVAAEEGLVGLALFLVLNFMVLTYARRTVYAAARLKFRELGISATIVEVSMLIIMVEALSGSSEHMKYQWIFTGLALSLKRIADDCEAAGRRVSIVPAGE